MVRGLGYLLRSIADIENVVVSATRGRDTGPRGRAGAGHRGARGTPGHRQA